MTRARASRRRVVGRIMARVRRDGRFMGVSMVGVQSDLGGGFIYKDGMGFRLRGSKGW